MLALRGCKVSTISRSEYAAMFGPTVGDQVRLGDTNLWAEVEKDFAVYGDECLHGGGKTLRDGMGMKAGVTSKDGALDMLICNVVIVDAVIGIVKADIGIKDGKIAGIGKAGNPDVMEGVDPNLIVGAGTTVRDAEGLIATAGAIDVHVHFDSAQLVEHAISSGITTMLGGSLGPITVGIDSGGTFNVGKMLQASEQWPMNFGFLGRGNAHLKPAMYEQIENGCLGLKIHEDWGAMPAAIDCCLSVADELDFQVQLHTDTLNESGFVEDTLNAIDGRTIHMYHTGRIRAQTIAAEDILHDMGAISMIGSDSQGMGRINEVITRTWQLASKMKDQRGRLKIEKTKNGDNERIKRFIAKYTINAARCFGIEEHVGSLEPGKMADIVLWRPGFFGSKPEIVVKGGFIAWGAMGDSAASLMTCEPVILRPQWGAYGGAAPTLSACFVNPLAIENDIKTKLSLKKNLLPAVGTRKLQKKDMHLNDAAPDIRVDPSTFDVFVDGKLAYCDPASELPLTQRYMLR